MSNYDNTNRGALFRNPRRRDDKDPSHTGSINVEGREFWIDAWVNESKKDGSKFFGLKVKPKDAPAKAAPEKPAAPEPEELNDDIPF